MSEINTRLGAVQAEGRITREHVHIGFNRVHERIDNLPHQFQKHIDGLQDRMARVETRMETPNPPETAVATLKAWAELVAPLRELLMVAAAILGSLYAILQPSPVREVLGALIALFPGG